MRVSPTATALLILLLTTFSHADDGLRQDLQRLQRLQEAVNVDADHVEYNEAERKLMAKGNVHIVLGQRSLFADEVSVDLEDQELVGTGHVILMEGLNRLEGDRIEYNYRTNLGVVSNARARFGPGGSFSGVEIRREGERTYRVTDGRFTTCRACQPEPQSPDWEMRAKEATVYLDEMVTARDASFWVRGIPAVYSPILGLPIGPRRTGFLIPTFGYSNSNGFLMRLPFFWAISPSQDLTLLPAYRSKSGFELPADYRYILSEDSRGELYGRYIYQFNNPSLPTNQAELKWLHDQVLSPTWTFKAFVQAQTSTGIQRTFSDTPAIERTQRTLDSNVFVTQSTPQYMLLGLLNYTRDLQGVSETRTGQLPNVTFQWMPGQLLGTPLIAGGETSAVYLTRNQGTDAGRFDFYPGVRLPVPLTPWVTATSLAAFRETAYTASQTSGGGTNRALVELGEELTSQFARRFDEPGLGLLRLTHIVEPSLAYLYVPWTDQQSLPQFGPTDFVSPQNRLLYQLTNRLIARWREAGGEIRSHEVVSLNIAQSWNMQPQTRPFSNVYLTGLTPERVDQAVNVVQLLSNGFSEVQERVWSNLVFNTTLSPVPGAAFRWTLALNTQTKQTDAINALLEIKRPDFLTVDAGYTYDRGRQAEGVVGRIELQATKTIRLNFVTQYNLQTSTLMENDVGLRYSSCCWEVRVGYIYRNKGPGQKPENSVHVIFSLRTGLEPSKRWEGFRPAEEAISGER
jgi:LPS-assembly protein